ncbi:MarR family winged helix-turn-helix transcriptional regulator [Actinospongicola halichondriae]|uniref:MarR family winged helix-turn-helix transcriptional regulator n=1 Tax=Actinospongicola halichondriae TaxID=3236844 RepID=UPI003D4EE86C
MDRIVAQWRRERPDLDPSAKEVTGRLIRLADAIGHRNADVLGPLGLTGAQYGVLSALRRAGEPYELNPTELARNQMMTSGGMTPVIDALERAGLVARRANPDDRRSRLVALTPDGLSRIDEAMEVHAATEHECVAGLTKTDQRKLVELLRKLTLAMGTDISSP